MDNMTNEWKPINSAIQDKPIQVKLKDGIPITAMISSKYGEGCPILLNEFGDFVFDGEGGYYLVLADLWREITN